MLAIYEFQGRSIVMYLMMGHIPADKFQSLLFSEHNKVCSEKNIEHTYYRNVPYAGSDEMIMVEAKGPGRGAYAATIVDYEACSDPRV